MCIKEIVSRIGSSEMVISVGFELFLVFLYIYAHICTHMHMYVYGQEEVRRPSVSYRETVYFL